MDRKTDRKIDKQSDKKTNRMSNKQIARHIGSQAHIQLCKQAEDRQSQFHYYGKQKLINKFFLKVTTGKI